MHNFLFRCQKCLHIELNIRTQLSRACLWSADRLLYAYAGSGETQRSAALQVVGSGNRQTAKFPVLLGEDLVVVFYNRHKTIVDRWQLLILVRVDTSPFWYTIDVDN